jgi:glycerol kinase
MTTAPRPTGPIILALDVGTTGVKAVAFDLASPCRHVAIREYGRATQLTDAVYPLTSIDEAAEARINPDVAMATTYAQLRGSVPRLVTGLDAVASLFAGTRHRDPTTDVRNR